MILLRQWSRGCGYLNGAKHQPKNIGDEDLVFVEIQLGEYFGEDDIVRLEDKYGRV